MLIKAKAEPRSVSQNEKTTDKHSSSLRLRSVVEQPSVEPEESSLPCRLFRLMRGTLPGLSSHLTSAPVCFYKDREKTAFFFPIKTANKFSPECGERICLARFFLLAASWLKCGPSASSELLALYAGVWLASSCQLSQTTHSCLINVPVVPDNPSCLINVPVGAEAHTSQGQFPPLSSSPTVSQFSTIKRSSQSLLAKLSYPSPFPVSPTTGLFLYPSVYHLYGFQSLTKRKYEVLGHLLHIWGIHIFFHKMVSVTGIKNL